jgi:hypothetical protein
LLFIKYNYDDQVRKDEMGKTCSMNWENRNAYRLFVGKPERERVL